MSIAINGEKQMIPDVVPETELEKSLFDGAPERDKLRMEKREQSKALAKRFGTKSLWLAE